MTAFNMTLPIKAERCARFVEANPAYRVLRRLPRPDEVWLRSMPVPEAFSSTRVAVIDTETTGLDPSKHKIIELAIVKMTVDDVVGDLLDITPPRSWLEDPGEPLTEEIETLTGLTDADLRGQCFDERIIAEAFDDVDCIVAHNMAFDSRFLRARFPDLRHPMACSMAGVDWQAHGLDGGRSVTALLTGAGHFPDHAHRAGPDAWSVAVLLAMEAKDGKTIAWHLVNRARKPTHRMYAKGAPFAVKDSLKAAGYAWCSKQRAWWLEADPERIDNECAWLAALCPAIMPRVERIDWYTRYSS